MARIPLAELEIVKLLEKYHLLSAVELLEKMASDGMPVNKTTIYRTLEKLLTKNVICRHSLGSDTLHYELRNHHHDHAVCENCGQISALDCQTNLVNLPKTKNFTPLHHHLTIFGLCQNCSKTAPKVT